MTDDELNDDLATRTLGDFDLVSNRRSLVVSLRPAESVLPEEYSFFEIYRCFFTI